MQTTIGTSGDSPKTLQDYLQRVAHLIATEFLPKDWVGRIEINYFNGGGSINVLESRKFTR